MSHREAAQLPSPQPQLVRYTTSALLMHFDESEYKGVGYQTDRIAVCFALTDLALLVGGVRAVYTALKATFRYCVVI